jgi:magnesium transporter
MLTAFLSTGEIRGVPAVAESADLLGDSTWIDLLDPTPEETALVERTLGVELPTRKEAQEIEVSSRLYIESGMAFMTATVPVRTDSPHPGTTPVTFAYHGQRLITSRFATPTPFQTFPPKLERTPRAYPTAQKVFLGLVDEVIDRLADILESVAAELNEISNIVFPEEGPPGERRSSVDYTALLTRVGRTGERAAHARESLVSLGRVVTFFRESRPASGSEPLDEHWRAVAQDIAALTEHTTFVSGKVNFFLDATLGRINIEQNTIIKLFSVLAVVFLPPTLIASIYGMNFARMPELGWLLGYPFSLVLMVISAILPYLIFKQRGWL